MRAIKAAFLLALIALVGWGLINLGQMVLALYPDYKLWMLGAGIACIYVLGDALDRSREWLGWRGGERRTYRRAWGPWR